MEVAMVDGPLLSSVAMNIRDEIFEQISSSTAENLQEARDILNKIVRRKLPKFVGEARLTEKNKSKVGQKLKKHIGLVFDKYSNSI
ncbi:deoxynucleoside triphosphate triphosphohydrolase SAMHD1-like protein [Labeo rohita]|uniref:Deoxynucleoside triphosphate triphosphohydrolase SAMHD1-like protein n=1 Tax=Labeo rohita TaxID=84645 RepID=A0A498NI73_LABRO|nr:deoxynucleoside triphosphate triphosphohydrolase SAMHD1-like protein [Labeo rohita]